MLLERLQKFMARCGVASRRDCELIIKEGRVFVNNRRVTELGVKIDPEKDRVSVDGNPIRPEEELIYIVLNKPKGYICSVKDPHGRLTIMDLIGKRDERLYPVGRLDYDSEGLLLITNDGALTHYLTHPKYEIEKHYRVLVSGIPRDTDIDKLRKGIVIDNYTTHPAKIERIKSVKDNTLYRVIIHEGRNRQVRKMFDSIGHPVIDLRRECFGNVSLGALEPGTWRYLNVEEINGLKEGMNNAKV